ncbi:MAG: aldo/keto reductase [Rhodospirillaceae bacterium]|jgi:aryl-alcohol dehydrogenase-like predicted oxidoreductase|nr:aldo/keto reductase [Rhodospirillaceae bacterium]MBT5299266.1 aldo/keto reductase [Rhodospirillaceae bacterium]MBT5515308.1 aldo/keto reductase [Rhodospirillaceae bacterium]MBT6085772.1 aldo/keto reductase [Rhodospirillaceae bacterium]MBT6608072.1 aldo/keto reductase [Rhodospirillaceae bacterium]
MHYVPLGSSGLKVSQLCLGAMNFGGRSTDAAAAKIVGMARDAGVNFIDTAESYAGGKSEEVLSKLIKRDRDSWVLATKLGSKAIKDGPNQRGLSRAWMMDAIEGSLTRLKTDYIDIYYLHRADPGTPMEETLGAMGDLIAQGKVRYWGFSNFRAWKIADMVRLADSMGVPRPIIAQPYYSILYRAAEFEYLPACDAYGIGVVPYSPLARGVLTGRFGTDPKAAKAAVADMPWAASYGDVFNERELTAAAKVKARAEASGMTAGQFALNWVLANGIVTSVIAGPRTVAHWKDYLGAFDHPFGPDDEAFVDDLLHPGYPFPIGYHEQKDNPVGRVPPA